MPSRYGEDPSVICHHRGGRSAVKGMNDGKNSGVGESSRELGSPQGSPAPDKLAKTWCPSDATLLPPALDG